MTTSKSKFGFLGIALGGIALLMALVHFWAGPFSPTPTLETTIAEKAASIRTATIKALKGEDYKEVQNTAWNADKLTYTATAVLGGLALVLSIVALANDEPKKIVLGGAILGTSAIVFQFMAMYLMVLLVVLLICAVLGSIGFG